MFRVSTFNLNNLFSRFNFQGEISDAPATGSGGITLTFNSRPNSSPYVPWML